MKKSLLNANLLKKYHHDLVYDYTEYPTKGNWSYDFGSEDYKNSLYTWIAANPKAPILFYVHTPFCEKLFTFVYAAKKLLKTMKR